MSEPEPVPMAEEISLSPPAAAVLEFTSNIGEEKKGPAELTYITSKDAYIWAGVAVLIAQYAQKKRAKFVEKEIHAQVHAKLCEAIKRIWTDTNQEYSIFVCSRTYR
jgi:hypothetical protein